MSTPNGMGLVRRASCACICMGMALASVPASAGAVGNPTSIPCQGQASIIKTVKLAGAAKAPMMIHIVREPEPPVPEEEPMPRPLPYTQKEIDMIAAVVMHEVGYCSRESKIAVTNTILNRVKDGRFGKTIYEVLHQRNQFGAIHNYYDHALPPDQACIDAVMDALAGEDNSMGALYYCNPRYVNSVAARRWFASLQTLFQLDGQIFYR